MTDLYSELANEWDRSTIIDPVAAGLSVQRLVPRIENYESVPVI